MYKVYGDIQSGNCYKVKWLLELLKMKHEWIHVDIVAGETRTQQFATWNPNMKVPLLQLEEGRYLAESNAILNYLAEGSAYLPEEPYARALVLQWQFFEQYSHEPYIAVARYIKKFLGMPEARRDEFTAKQVGGHRALAVMEKRLSKCSFLVGEEFTIADISLYAYTHVAHEGGFDLSGYPGINKWMASIRVLPGHVSMDDFPRS